VIKQVRIKSVLHDGRPQLCGQIFRRDAAVGAMLTCFRRTDRWKRVWSVPDIAAPGFPFDRSGAQEPFARCKALAERTLDPEPSGVSAVNGIVAASSITTAGGDSAAFDAECSSTKKVKHI